MLIEEEIKYNLNNIAYRLYHLKFAFKQLTSQEQQLWKSFPLCDIYEWLTGDPYTPPDYNEYIRFRSTIQPNQPQLQPQAPQPHQIQPLPAVEINRIQGQPRQHHRKNRVDPPGPRISPRTLSPGLHTTHQSVSPEILQKTRWIKNDSFACSFNMSLHPRLQPNV
jgi:hypothetical protein